MSKHPRKKHVINPRLQWKLTTVFLCLACMALLLEAMVLNRVLVRVADKMPRDGEILLGELPGMLSNGLLLSALVVVPLTVSFGLLATFRVAGPIYRFEEYLKRVVRGEKPGPCKIRTNDELQELCDLINEATAPLRRAELVLIDAKPDEDSSESDSEEEERTAV